MEAVIDKDLASELLAREVDADLFVMATDVDGVYDGWGTADQRRLERVTPDELRRRDFAAGSMGPKVEAAVRFVETTGRRAAIGSLSDIEQIVEGHAGTTVALDRRPREDPIDGRVRRPLRGRPAPTRSWCTAPISACSG